MTTTPDTIAQAVTVTEKWNGAESVRWTARAGRTVVADVVSRNTGGVHSGELRDALALYYGTTPDAVTSERKKSDAARVVPARWSVAVPAQVAARAETPTPAPRSTPWGTPQDVRHVAPGIVRVDTPGHGGYHVRADLHELMPAPVRELDGYTGGWYEEDCTWAFVALAFPAHFDADVVAYAHESAARNYPEEYAQTYAGTYTPDPVRTQWATITGDDRFTLDMLIDARDVASAAEPRRISTRWHAIAVRHVLAHAATEARAENTARLQERAEAFAAKVDLTGGELDAAITAHQETPTPGTHARVMDAQRAHVARFNAETTGEYQERTRTDRAPAKAEPRTAQRVTMHEARRHFEAGGDVLVSERGHERTQLVGPDTTTHNRERTTWEELAATVKEWRNRYPNQRFYVVEEVPAPDVAPLPDRSQVVTTYPDGHTSSAEFAKRSNAVAWVEQRTGGLGVARVDLIPSGCELAETAGRAAYAENAPAAPWADATVRGLVEGLAVGGGAAQIFEAFTRGYQSAADTAAQAILDADRTPANVPGAAGTFASWGAAAAAHGATA